jgi:hypothetical protein
METAKKTSLSVRILDALAAAGDTGMTFTELQRKVYALAHPGGHPLPQAKRGWWCTQFLGGPFYHAGLLHVYAVKGPDGRWRRNDVPHDGRPWTRTNRALHKSRACDQEFVDE